MPGGNRIPPSPSEAAVALIAIAQESRHGAQPATVSRGHSLIAPQADSTFCYPMRDMHQNATRLMVAYGVPKSYPPARGVFYFTELDTNHLSFRSMLTTHIFTKSNPR